MINFCKILFVYLFIHLFIDLFLRNCIKLNFSNICTFFIKDFLDFDLCNNVCSRKQIIKHVKKRKMREKHRKQIFFFDDSNHFHENSFLLFAINLSKNIIWFNTRTIWITLTKITIYHFLFNVLRKTFFYWKNYCEINN